MALIHHQTLSYDPSVATGTQWSEPLKSRVVNEFLPSRTTESDGGSGAYGYGAALRILVVSPIRFSSLSINVLRRKMRVTYLDPLTGGGSHVSTGGNQDALELMGEN